MEAHDTHPAAGRPTLSGLALRCPPLPQTLIEAMALTDSRDALDVAEVTEMVRRDPVVVARLLHVVNSSYYGLRHTISSVERAVVMLGPVAVSGIVVGMQMLQLRSALEGPASACFNRLIRHSIATAFLTRHLVEGGPRSDGTRPRRDVRSGVSFTTGLLHDFGKIILVYNYPREAVALYEERTLGDQVAASTEREMEQLLFGFDHTEAGEYVARKLNFPEALTQVIRHHHEPHYPTGAPETDRLLRAAAVANTAAKAIGYAFTDVRTRTACLNDPAWHPAHLLDVARTEDAEGLFDALRALQPHLDDYVRHLTVPARGFEAPSRPAGLSRTLVAP